MKQNDNQIKTRKNLATKHYCTDKQLNILETIGYKAVRKKGELMFLVIDWIREYYNMYVEAYLTNICSKHISYTIRVSSPEGGNVLKYTSLTEYYDALSAALDMALNLIKTSIEDINNLD